MSNSTLFFLSNFKANEDYLIIGTSHCLALIYCIKTNKIDVFGS